MLTSLLLGAALAAPGAPVPATADPAPAGPAPWVLHLKADDNGRAQVMIYKTQKVTQSRAVTETVDGKQVTKVIQEQVERTMPTYVLLDAQNPTLTTAGGSKVLLDNLMKQAKAGIVVLVSADGKPVSKSWLRTVDPETVVVTADGLVSEASPRGIYGAPTAPPRLVLLGTDAKGKVQVAYNPNATNNGGAYYGGRGGRMFINGGQQMFIDDSGYYSPNVAPSNTEAPVKGLEDIAFEAYDLKGKTVSKAEAMKRLSAGGYALIAGDNRLPAESYLKSFRGDLLVLVSQDLVNVPTGKVKNNGAVAAPAPAALPAVRGVLVKPGIIQAAPLKLAPAPVPAPAAEKADPAPAPKAVPAPAVPVPAVAKPAVIRAVPLKVAPAIPLPVEREAIPVPAPVEKK